MKDSILTTVISQKLRKKALGLFQDDWQESLDAIVGKEVELRRANMKEQHTPLTNPLQDAYAKIKSFLLYENSELPTHLEEMAMIYIEKAVNLMLRD